MFSNIQAPPKRGFFLLVTTMHHCYHCGREIHDATRSLHVMIIESHSGRLGTAHLHCDCAEPTLSRYRQTIEWAGTIGNLEKVKQLHRRLASANGVSFGSVPLLLT